MKEELESFIRYHTPTGWNGSIHEFDFGPSITDAEYKIICEGHIPFQDKFDKWYVKEAIQAWMKKNGITEVGNIHSNGSSPFKNIWEEKKND